MPNKISEHKVLVLKNDVLLNVCGQVGNLVQSKMILTVYA